MKDNYDWKTLCYPSTCHSIRLYFSVHILHYINIVLWNTLLPHWPLTYYFVIWFFQVIKNHVQVSFFSVIALHHMSQEMNYFHCRPMSLVFGCLLFTHENWFMVHDHRIRLSFVEPIVTVPLFTILLLSRLETDNKWLVLVKLNIIQSNRLKYLKQYNIWSI